MMPDTLDISKETLIDEMATAAADWWADKTTGPLGKIDEGLSGMVAAQMLLVAVTQPARKRDSRTVFTASLKEAIKAHLGKFHTMILDTDYGPETPALCVAARNAGISGMAFPHKTTMLLDVQGPTVTTTQVRGRNEQVYPRPA